MDSEPLAPSKQAPAIATGAKGGFGFQQAGALVALAGLAAALLCIQSLWHSHFARLSEYDDGVYFAAALNLVHGKLPYSGFDFLQPPLIAVWLAPFALVAAHTSERFGFELARFFTDLVTVADVVLVGVIMWGRGISRMVIAVAITALSVGLLSASQTVMIEPYLDFWCLLGLAALARPRLPGRFVNHALVAGACFGIAGATKVWAVVPALVVLVVLWTGSRRRARDFALGTATAFVLAVLPFAISDPLAAFRQVVLAQAQRGFSGEVIAGRLANLSGFALLTKLSVSREYLVTVIVLAALVIVIARWRWVYRRQGTGDDSELARIYRFSAVAVGITLFVAPGFYYHYGAFFAPFLGLALGSAAAFTKVSKRVLVAVGSAVVSLAFAGDLQAAFAPKTGVLPSGVPLVAPGGGCVVSDQPALLILTNSFTGYRSGCPSVVDWLGTERVLVHGTSGVAADSASPVFQRVLLSWMAESRVVVLSSIDAGIGATTERVLLNEFQRAGRSDFSATIYVHDPGEIALSERRTS